MNAIDPEYALQRRRSAVRAVNDALIELQIADRWVRAARGQAVEGFPAAEIAPRRSDAEGVAAYPLYVATPEGRP